MADMPFISPAAASARCAACCALVALATTPSTQGWAASGGSVVTSVVMLAMYVVVILDSFFWPSATPIICTVPLPAMAVSALLTRHIMALPSIYVSAGYAASSPGRVFTRDNLLTLVWGYEHVGNYRAVDSHIKRLRQKLDAYPHDFFTIATVWGTGYKFERRLP